LKTKIVNGVKYKLPRHIEVKQGRSVPYFIVRLPTGKRVKAQTRKEALEIYNKNYNDNKERPDVESITTVTKHGIKCVITKRAVKLYGSYKCKQATDGALKCNGTSAINAYLRLATTLAILRKHKYMANDKSWHKDGKITVSLTKHPEYKKIYNGLVREVPREAITFL